MPRRRCTLSFDNGPHPETTPEVLDLLRERGLDAVFFVCGRNLESAEGRALVARARAEGHRVGNHTYTHSIELGRTDDPGAPASEIGRTQELLGPLADSERLFRPCGGGGHLGPNLLSRDAVEYLEAGGYTCVLWNCVPRDWENTTGWVERALAEVSERDWSLVVLHDLPTGAMAMLPEFLDKLSADGVEITTELPPECVPIQRGRVVAPLDAWVGR